MLRRRQRALWVTVIVLVAAVVPPFVNVNRFRARLASSASRSLGRQVSLGNVSIRLLPRPGFDITDFVVEDDPAFSAEPFLSSPRVTADLRLASLWRGRFEIARLTLKDPSLNLVRDAAGRWNLAALLARASQVPAAPSGKRSAEPRPRFPYIEADTGRINFKFLQRKLPHSFVDADFSLWLESESEWRAHLEGRPIRTDAHLGDTGIVKLDLSAERGRSLEETPVDLRFTWRDAQLGQLTELITGSDPGWRGAVSASGSAKGTPRELELDLSTTVEDFRRYDIASISRVVLSASCAGTLHASGGPSTLDGRCQSALGRGHIIAAGHTQVHAAPEYDVSLTATEVPVFSLATIARVSKRNLPDDFSASGVLDASLHFLRDASGEHALGEAQLVGLAVNSPSLSTNATFTPLRFAFATTQPPARKRRQANTPASEPASLASRTFEVSINNGSPLSASAVITASGVDLHISGQTQLQSLLAAAQLAGVKPPRVNALGTAQVDLDLAGVWAGFTPPVATGNARLTGVTTRIEGIASPVEITSARLLLDRQVFRLEQMIAKIGGQAIAGNVSVPRICDGPCTLSFALTSPQLDFEALHAELDPRLRPGNWYQTMKQFFGGTPPEDRLMGVKAQGTLIATRFTVGRLLLTNADADVVFNAGTLRVTKIQAQTLGGTYTGAVEASFASPPELTISGDLENASAAELARLTSEAWGSGVLSGHFEVHATGNTASQLRANSTGHIQFDWSRGALRFVAAAPSAPSRPAATSAPQELTSLEFSRWRGSAHLDKGELFLDSGTMTGRRGTMTTTGIVAAGQRLLLLLKSPEGSQQLQGQPAPLISPPATAASN